MPGCPRRRLRSASRAGAGSSASPARNCPRSMQAAQAGLSCCWASLARCSGPSSLPQRSLMMANRTPGSLVSACDRAARDTLRSPAALSVWRTTVVALSAVGSARRGAALEPARYSHASALRALARLSRGLAVCRGVRTARANFMASAVRELRNKALHCELPGERGHAQRLRPYRLRGAPRITAGSRVSQRLSVARQLSDRRATSVRYGAGNLPHAGAIHVNVRCEGKLERVVLVRPPRPTARPAPPARMPTPFASVSDLLASTPTVSSTTVGVVAGTPDSSGPGTPAKRAHRPR
jgi:hypothetical protein